MPSFRLLGPLEVMVGDLAVGSLRQRALLTMLLLHPNQIVPASRLIDRLWGEAPARDPRAALQTAVWGLRRTLTPPDGTAFGVEIVTPSANDSGPTS